MNKKENINNNMEVRMKKSSDQGFFNIYPFITSPSTLDQDEQKLATIKLKYWVSRNSVILQF